MESERRPGWLIAEYQPTAMFSLRSTLSTSTGGATLLLPTPYSVKLALVDAAYRVGGKATAIQTFDWIKTCEVRFKPPGKCVVNHSFTKIRQPSRPERLQENTGEEEQNEAISDEGDGITGLGTPYKASIGYREYCAYTGKLEISLQSGAWTIGDEPQLERLFAHINYFGKRGSFFQFLGMKSVEDLPPGFTILPEEWDRLNPNLFGVLQYLDDLGKGSWPDFFERVNYYSEKDLKSGVHRVLRQYLLPYKKVKSAKAYTFYSSMVDS